MSGIYKDKCKCVIVITEELIEKGWNNIDDKFKNSLVSTEDFKVFYYNLLFSLKKYNQESF